MKVNSGKRVTILASMVACGCLALTARANTYLGLGNSAQYTIGQVFGSASNGGEPDHDNADISQLLSMGASTSGNFDITSGTTDYGTFYYTRSTLSTAGLSLTTTGQSYTDKTAIGGLPQTTHNGEAYVEVTLPLTGGYTFLLAKYDGKNGGGQLWDIAGIAAGTTIDIPLNAVTLDSNGSVIDSNDKTTQPVNLGDTTSGGYGMTSFLLSTGTSSVPDGGTTAIMLGGALTGIGLIRRKLR